MTPRDEIAEEQGLEHTGGLGEREGAGTAGGAEVGPTPQDEDLGDLEKRGEQATPPRRDRSDDPSEAERLGFGDVGELGDESSTGSFDAQTESPGERG